MSHIVILIGSLRTNSLNRKLAELASNIAPEGMKVELIEELDQVPFYNEDLDTDTPPAQVKKLRSTVTSSDGVLVVTPENNGTIPAVLKNAVDWLSRPYRNGAIKDKPFAVMGTSLGHDGGLKGLEASVHSFVIAGGKKIDVEVLAIPSSLYNGTNPHLNEKVVSQVAHVLQKLNANINS